MQHINTIISLVFTDEKSIEKNLTKKKGYCLSPFSYMDDP